MDRILRHLCVGFIIALVLAALGLISCSNNLKELNNFKEKSKPTRMNSLPYENATTYMKYVQNSDVIYLPDKDILRRLSRQEREVVFYRYIFNIQHLCQRKARLGNIGDGGWEICEEGKYRPKPPCIVYSFGSYETGQSVGGAKTGEPREKPPGTPASRTWLFIYPVAIATDLTRLEEKKAKIYILGVCRIGNDFSYDDAVIKRYGCEVHSFDPTMKSDSYRRGPLNYFYAIGIAGDNRELKDGRELMTFESIRQRLGHSQKNITVVKMDIEEWEFDALPNMLMSKSLQQVDNLAVELHLPYMPPHHILGPAVPKDQDKYLKVLLILKDLYDIGFRIFWVTKNVWCKFKPVFTEEILSSCQEVSFVRVNHYTDDEYVGH